MISMAGNISDTLDYPNQERYPRQHVHVIVVDEYIDLVPFAESDEEDFLTRPASLVFSDHWILLHLAAAAGGVRCYW